MITKKQILIFFCILIFLLISGCSEVNQSDQPVADEQVVVETLNAELAKVMECYKEALVNNDPASVDKLIDILQEFDTAYGSELAPEFRAFITEKQSGTRLSDPIVDFPPLTDLPVERDGDIYLSGGANSLAGYLVDWVAPNVTEANYNHAAILDLDKFDPTNLDVSCFQTAGEKGASYESPMNWMTKQNVGVMTPVITLPSAPLNAAQADMDYYCDPDNTDMAYGFFKDTVNIFSLVTKADNYYWYCTKVVWRVYYSMGYNIDSNSPLIDWSTSGLYSIVKAYFDIVYFWNPDKAEMALQAYMNIARNTIVLAEEIYFMPKLSLFYETIR